MRHILTAAVAFSLGVAVSRLVWVGATEAQSVQPIELGNQKIRLGVTRDEILAKYPITTTHKTEQDDEILIWSGTVQSDPDYHMLGKVFFRKGENTAWRIIKDWRTTTDKAAEPLWAGFYGAIASATRMRKASAIISVDTGTEPDFRYEKIIIEFPGHSVDLLRLSSYQSNSVSYFTSENFGDFIGADIKEHR